MRRGLPRWLVGLVAAVYAFLHLPILVLVAFSFNASKFSVEWTGFSLEWYRRLLERDDILRGLRASLVVGVLATVIATLLGTLLALGLARHRFRGRRVLEALLYVPIVTPEIVAGISLLILYVLVGLPLGLVT
ncbi:MAG TPA: ABC transporter permease, partial [Anaeromyxobacteraceae bacterium]|nr:ABC transporter permease [Anaeromyxobacteraceae bacterium]